MKKPPFSLAAWKDAASVELVHRTGHQTLARWAIACVERVLPLFADPCPLDPRPRQALRTLQQWIDSGVFSMNVIRRASLAAHAAAREMNEDNAARSVARAAGQAVATAHVPLHALGAANYALQAIHRVSAPEDAAAAVAAERDWQWSKLRQLSESET